MGRNMENLGRLESLANFQVLEVLSPRFESRVKIENNSLTRVTWIPVTYRIAVAASASAALTFLTTPSLLCESPSSEST